MFEIAALCFPSLHSLLPLGLMCQRILLLASAIISIAKKEGKMQSSQHQYKANEQPRERERESSQHCPNRETQHANQHLKPMAHKPTSISNPQPTIPYSKCP